MQYFGNDLTVEFEIIPQVRDLIVQVKDLETRLTLLEDYINKQKKSLEEDYSEG